MGDFIACPYCGKKIPVGSNICPHCCKRLPYSAENETFPMSHSKWEHIHKKRKARIIKAAVLLAGFILGFHLFTMRYCGAVAFLDPFTSVKYRAMRLGPLAEEPAMEIEYPYTSPEELNAMEDPALWLNPEKIKAAHPALTEEELTALDTLCKDKLPFGASRETCLSALNEKLSAEEAQQLLDYCQIDFKAQALRHAIRSMNSQSYSEDELGKALDIQGFTEAEVQYALQNCGADWAYQTELAVKEMIFYLEASEKRLKERLINDGHNPIVIGHILEGLEPDWNREALQAALRWDDSDNMHKTRKILEDHLEWKGFTKDQIQYAVDLMRLR